MFIAIFALPESPRFLYSKQKFDEARKSLNVMADFNGCKNLNNFLFDNEIESEEQKEQRMLKEHINSCKKKNECSGDEKDEQKFVSA